MSPRDVASNSVEQMMLVMVIRRGSFDVTTSGTTMRTSGTRTRIGDAGSLSGPSHQVDRPMVRLVMAMATRLAPVRIHEMNDTVRHPSDKLTVGGCSADGGSKSMSPPYCGLSCMSQQ